MPTGYTSIIEEGATFEEYVWRCARGMGALIMMRDESLDALIPERFEPSTWHIEQLEKAQTRLKELVRMTEQERDDEGRRLKDAAVTMWANALQKYQREEAQHNAMRAQVEAWLPPTPDHEGLKRFMLDQLEESMKYSGFQERELMKAQLKRPHEYYEEGVRSANDDIEYHTDKQREEIERTNERNAWLRALRESVPYPKEAR